MPDHHRYITCALWASHDTIERNGNQEYVNLDDSSFELSERAKAFLEHKAQQFQDKMPVSTAAWDFLFGEGQWEYDLWLTQNSHGAGFWARKEPAMEIMGKALFKRLQDTLTQQARAFGELNLYLADDGFTIECCEYFYQQTQPVIT